jgi:hypothetical protein
MCPKCTKLGILRSKDCYNRITLQMTWTHSRKNNALKFGRLRFDYGDSRVNYLEEKRSLSEGLKI